MGVFYKVSEKQLLKDRNNSFKEVGIPALQENGFCFSPLKGAWQGEYDNNNESYNYEFCRIAEDTFLEILDVSIYKKDRRINCYLGVFQLRPKINSPNELKGYDAIPFAMTIKNKSSYMQLRSDDYKGPPFFYLLFLPQHKVSRYFTKAGYESGIKKLRKLIKLDMENIDHFVKRWHELHIPINTDWEGNTFKEATQ